MPITPFDEAGMTDAPADSREPGAAAPAQKLNSLNDLRAFVAVAESGSFSAAARVLGISQPAVSQRVRTVESICGMRLIDRRTGAGLTAAGQELFHRARLVLARADEFDAMADDLRGLRMGRLKLGYATPAFAIPLVARFRAAHPGLQIDYHYGNTAELFAGLRQCRLDAAVTSLLEVPPDLVARRIAVQRLMLCVPRAHPLAHGAPPELAQLADMPLLMREEGSMTRTIVEQVCRERGLGFAQASVMPTREAVKEGVAAGLGLGFVLAGEFGDDPRLAAVPLADAPDPVGVYALCHAETADLPAVRRLLELAGP